MKKLFLFILSILFCASVAFADNYEIHEEGVLIPDDFCIIWGDDLNFRLCYDETTNDALELSDGTNTFLSVTDDGSTATFNIFGDIDISGNVSSATYGSDSSITNGEFLYINTLSSNAQDQLDARCLESVFGTSIGAGLELSGTILKVDNVLEDLDTLGAPASDGQFIVATAAGVFGYESGPTALASLGAASTSHKDTHDPEDGSDKLDTAAPAELAGVQAAAEGSSHSLARADHAHQIQHNIADNHLATYDGTSNQPITTDYAKFTANGLEGRSYSEVMSDLSGTAGAEFLFNTQQIGGVVDPTTDQQVATKKYVDDNTSAFDPASPGEIGGTSPGVGNFTTLAVGSSGTDLAVSAAGEVTKARNPAFLVHLSGNQVDIVAGDDVTILFNTKIFDQGSDFNDGTYTFTAPITGRYQLNVLIYLQTSLDTAASIYQASFITSNRSYLLAFTPLFTADADYGHFAFSVLADMDASDTVYVAIQQTGGTNQVDIAGSVSFFSGYLAN